MLGATKLSTMFDVYGDIWIRWTTYRTLDSTSRTDQDLSDTDSSIKRFTRQHLFQIQGIHVWTIHHWLQCCVRHIINEGRQSWHLTRNINFNVKVFIEDGY